MYEFIRGPLVLIAFAVLLIGSAVKLIYMARLADKEKSVFPTMSLKFGLRSIIHWAIPFGTRNERMHPYMTIVSFAFHVCLLVTPLLAMGHAVLWQESWGVRWWSLPAPVADGMTITVIVTFFFLFLRRLTAPEVRNVNKLKDYLLSLVVVAPFITGFIVHKQWLPAEPMLILHIVMGVLWLVAIPFTWLAHMIWFLFTRAFMGSEFGAVRNARDY